MTTRTRTIQPDITQFLPQVAPRSPRQQLRRARKHPPANETARDRFIRIGGQRMKNVLRDLRLLGNLSSTNYDVSQRDIKVMQMAITRALDQSFSRFAKATNSQKIEDTFNLA